MGQEAWLTAGILTLVLVALGRRRQPRDLVLLGGAVALIITGVLTPQEGLQGFSNPQTFTLGSLLILSFAVRRTGAFERLYVYALTPRSTKASIYMGLASGVSPRLFSATGRLTWVVMGLSAIVEGVGIVAALIPRVEPLARRLGVPASKLMMPLAIASRLGGSLTFIGCLSTLYVNGVLKASGFESFGFFSNVPIALPAALLGGVVLILISPRLLPMRAGPREALEADRRSYLLEMALTPKSPLIGKRVREAGLRHLPGLFLVAIERGGRRLAPVAPSERLQGGDHLVFAGSVDTIRDLLDIPGLKALEEGEVGQGEERPKGDTRLIEAVISDRSFLLGVTVRDANFRGRFNAAVIAVHRHGERLGGRLGDVELRQGDTLLLEGGAGFSRAFRESEDFFLVSEIKESDRVRHHHGPRVALLACLMAGVMALGIWPIVSVAVLAAISLVVFKILSVGEAREGVAPSVIIVFGATFSLGAALTKSGLGLVLGEGVATLGAGWAGAVVLIYLGTTLLANVVGGIIGAGILLPIALGAAQALGVGPSSMSMAVILGAALTLSSPIANQTSRMVVGAGRYDLRDFLKVGLPVQVVAGVMVILGLLRVGP